MRELITAGVDEVGRGCLAGPVVSAAVILKKGINFTLLKDSKKITFKIDSSNFNENEVAKLKNTLSKHKGSKPVYFDIHDSKNKFKLNMISEQAKVSITKELLVSLEQDEFRYKLN